MEWMKEKQQLSSAETQQSTVNGRQRSSKNECKSKTLGGGKWYSVPFPLVYLPSSLVYLSHGHSFVCPISTNCLSVPFPLVYLPSSLVYLSYIHSFVCPISTCLFVPSSILCPISTCSSVPKHSVFLGPASTIYLSISFSFQLG